MPIGITTHGIASRVSGPASGSELTKFISRPIPSRPDPSATRDKGPLNPIRTLAGRVVMKTCDQPVNYNRKKVAVEQFEAPASRQL